MWEFSSSFEHTISVCDGRSERVKVRVWCQWLMSPGQAAGSLQVTSWYPPSLIIHPFMVPKCHIKPIQRSLQMCVCVVFFFNPVLCFFYEPIAAPHVLRSAQQAAFLSCLFCFQRSFLIMPCHKYEDYEIYIVPTWRRPRGYFLQYSFLAAWQCACKRDSPFTPKS